MRILAFGDSITQGFWDLDGGWVARLRKTYDAQMIDGTNDDPPVVFNLGVSSNATDNLLQRFENEVKARNNGEAMVVIFAIGFNDSRIKGGKNYAEVGDYTANLEKLLAQAKQYTDKIYFVELTPCIEARSNPVAWDNNTAYTKERVELFNRTLREFCQKHTVPCITVYDQIAALPNLDELILDGVHPGPKVHQMIADAVGLKVEELTR
jgi:lysophospholipase L1-like esterase